MPGGHLAEKKIVLLDDAHHLFMLLVFPEVRELEGRQAVGSGGRGQEDRPSTCVQLFHLNLSKMKAVGLLQRTRRGKTAPPWGTGKQGQQQGHGEQA